MSNALLSDADIRPALRARVLAPHHGDPDTVLLEELGVCRGLVRVDLAVVNGIIHGFEIKSDRDTLRRLEGQIESYSKVLDRATLVTSERHVDDALRLVPAWWGLLRIDMTRHGGMRFAAVRRGRANPALDARALVELLWLEDALELLEQHGAARGVRGKPRRFVWDRVVESVEQDVIAAAVRAKLKARAASTDPPSPS